MTIQLQVGDVIAVPPEVIAVTKFSETSRLTIRRATAGQAYNKCHSCDRHFSDGDLYAACTEVTSHRCIKCVDGWPLKAGRIADGAAEWDEWEAEDSRSRTLSEQLRESPYDKMRRAFLAGWAAARVGERT